MASRNPLVLTSSNEVEEIPLLDCLGSAGTPEAGQVLGYNGTGFEWITPSGGGSNDGLIINDATDFGSGTDGAVTATTGTITADVNATTYTIPIGVTVTPGWNSAKGRPACIFATTKIDIKGTLDASGSNGDSYASAGIGIAGGASLTGGGGGAGGGTSATAGAGGVSGRPGSNGDPTVYGVRRGGNGGKSGAYSMARAGDGGDASVPDVIGYGGGIGYRVLSYPQTLDELVSWVDSGGAGGGGGGAGTGAGSLSAGGGGGGGGIGLFAPLVEISGTVKSTGGNGGNSAGNNSAGPGGGAGGTLVVGCRSMNIVGGTFNLMGGIGGEAGTTAKHDRGEKGGKGQIIFAAEVMPSIAGIDAAMFLITVVP